MQHCISLIGSVSFYGQVKARSVECQNAQSRWLDQTKVITLKTYFMQ